MALDAAALLPASGLSVGSALASVLLSALASSFAGAEDPPIERTFALGLESPPMLRTFAPPSLVTTGLGAEEAWAAGAFGA